MRDHPIPPVTEPFQYRAIGIVRGTYRPEDSDKLTRGQLLDHEGSAIEAVVLGRVLNLMRRHLAMDKPHLWVVYPRCRTLDHLHLQIAGIWEPSTLGSDSSETLNSKDLDSTKNKVEVEVEDELKEGDDYFSIRGELIYTRPETNDLVVRIRQKAKASGSRSMPFKLQLKGAIGLENLRNFVNLDVRRVGQQLNLESYEVIGPITTRGGKRGEAKAISKSRNLRRNK